MYLKLLKKKNPSIQFFIARESSLRNVADAQKMNSRITLSGLSPLQSFITDLYATQCSSASLLKLLSCTSSEKFASDNFLHVSRDFSGSDFCHLFTAPTIDGVDEPPVPGSPSTFKKHNNQYEQAFFEVFLRNKDDFLHLCLRKAKEEKRNKILLESSVLQTSFPLLI